MSSETSTHAVQPPMSPIADYEVIRCIGEGTFGRVCLARAKATKRYRAMKIVKRDKFSDDRPYEMEFAGVQKFEEVSREHEGFVDILHISRDNEAGHFAYVMELADDLDGRSPIEPGSYEPRTLSLEITRLVRLAPAECVRVGLALTAALRELHRRSLVHRDIKPANIVFVRGAPKLADIGLVTEMHSEESLVERTSIAGTPDYMDAELHGTARGDLYSLGKVIYVMATGQSARSWPELPADVDKIPDQEIFRELNRIFSKACDTDRARRYTSADEIHDELLLLSAGTWVLRWKRWEWLLRAVRRYGLAMLVLLLGVSGVLYEWSQRQKQMAELRQRKVGSYVAYGAHALENRDLPGALIWFAEAQRQDEGNPDADRLHRQRVGAVLRQCPTIIQMWFTDPAFSFGAFAGHENQVLLPTPGRRWAVHDLVTGTPLQPPFGEGLDFESPSVCEQRGIALTSSFTNELVLWNTRTGEARARLSVGAPAAVLYGASLSPDGRWAAALQMENNISSLALWDLGAPQSAPRVFTNSSQLLCVAFSPDSRRLVAGDKSARAVVRSVPEGEEISVGKLHSNWINSCAFSPDGRRIVSGGYDRKAFVWETETGRAVSAPMMHGDGVNAVQFSADGRRVATAGLDFNVRVWNAESGAIEHQLRHNSKPVYVSFSPSGRHLLTCGFDGILRVWDLKSREREQAPPRVMLSADGTRFAVVTNQLLQVRSVSGDIATQPIPLTVPDLLLWQLNRDGSRVLTVSSNMEGGRPRLFAQVFDTARRAVVGTGCTLDSVQPVLEFSPDGRRLLGSIGGQASVWEFSAGRITLALTNPVISASFAPSSHALAVGVPSGVEIWRWTGPDASRLYRWEYPHRVNAISWDPRGERVIIACLDPSFYPEAAYLRDFATGLSVGQPFRHRDGVCFAAFSPDGRKVITCSEDFTAVLWDSVTGGELAPPLQHAHQVLSAAFSADGRLVATGAKDGHARVWDAQTGEPITPPLAHSGPVRSVQFAADADRLFTHTQSGETRVWSLAPDRRTSADLLRVAGLLSAQQSHSTETMMPQSKESLKLLWQSLRTAYPVEFNLSP